MGRAPKGSGQGHPTGTSTPQPGHKKPSLSLSVKGGGCWEPGTLFVADHTVVHAGPAQETASGEQPRIVLFATFTAERVVGEHAAVAACIDNDSADAVRPTDAGGTEADGAEAIGGAVAPRATPAAAAAAAASGDSDAAGRAQEDEIARAADYNIDDQYLPAHFAEVRNQPTN